jgi:hypothetical protein
MDESEKLSQLLAEVTRQVFEGAARVETPAGSWRVGRTSRQGLRQVEFSAEDQKLIGIEQNPATGSRWAKLAREGHRVMQFKNLATNRYFANVVDGRVTFYGGSSRGGAGKSK